MLSKKLKLILSLILISPSKIYSMEHGLPDPTLETAKLHQNLNPNYTHSKLFLHPVDGQRRCESLVVVLKKILEKNDPSEEDIGHLSLWTLLTPLHSYSKYRTDGLSAYNIGNKAYLTLSKEEQKNFKEKSAKIALSMITERDVELYGPLEDGVDISGKSTGVKRLSLAGSIEKMWSEYEGYICETITTFKNGKYGAVENYYYLKEGENIEHIELDPNKYCLWIQAVMTDEKKSVPLPNYVKPTPLNLKQRIDAVVSAYEKNKFITLNGEKIEDCWYSIDTMALAKISYTEELIKKIKSTNWDCKNDEKKKLKSLDYDPTEEYVEEVIKKDEGTNLKRVNEAKNLCIHLGGWTDENHSEYLKDLLCKLKREEIKEKNKIKEWLKNNKNYTAKDTYGNKIADGKYLETIVWLLNNCNLS